MACIIIFTTVSAAAGISPFPKASAGVHNNLYYRIGSGWYQPLSQGFRRRAALLLYALLGAVVGPTGALALAAYAATPPPPS